jgi:hypothetical protein
MSAATGNKITKEDLERQLKLVQDKVVGTVESKRTTITNIVIAGVVVMALVFFLLGKRSGKRKSTVVEIRRV